MKNLLLVVACVFGFFTAANAGGMIVPAYWYPSGGGINDDWAQLAAAATYLRDKGTSGYDTLIAIGNPGSGPGAAKDINYLEAFTHVRGAGGKVVGYVFTNYGKTPYATVAEQISKWVDWYGPQLDGIFLDAWGGYQTGDISGSSPAVTYTTYYKKIQALVKGTYHLSLLIGNPGSAFDENEKSPAAVGLADIFCIEENTYPATANGNYVVPVWLQDSANSQKGCVLFYQLPLNQPVVLTSVVQTAKAKGIAWIYCTDNQSPASGNVWGSFPGVASGGTDGRWNAYWGNEQWSVALAHN